MNATIAALPAPSPTASHPVLRRIGPVLAGLVAVVVISTITDAIMHAAGVFPPIGQRASDGAFAIALGYRLVFGIAGAYLTARLARRFAAPHPMRHALVLGAIGTVIATIGAIATWHRDLGPHWYALALAATSLPTAWLGARLARRA